MGECRGQRPQGRCERLGPTVSTDSGEQSHLWGWWQDRVSGRLRKTGSQHSMRQGSHFCDLNASSIVFHCQTSSQISCVKGGSVPAGVGKGGGETEG